MAVLARTSVASARVATLTTYARQPHAGGTTTVTVAGAADGSVEVALSLRAHAVRQLLARPLATVCVAPPWCEPVTLQGAATRLPGADQTGRIRFRVAAAAVRIGHGRHPVDPLHYAEAEPDPLRHDAPAVLQHLNAGHGEALAACLRARGREVGYVQATALDADGLTVLAVSARGVDRLRLAFPRRVSSLQSLPASLSAVLQPECGCCRHGRVDG